MELIGKVSAGEGKEAEVVVNQTQGLCSSVEGCEPYMSKALGSMPSTTDRGGKGEESQQIRARGRQYQRLKQPRSNSKEQAGDWLG